MIVRRGSEADRDAALEVWRAALGGTGRRPSAVKAEAVRRQLDQDLLVVCDDGEPAGAAPGVADPAGSAGLAGQISPVGAVSAVDAVSAVGSVGAGGPSGTAGLAGTATGRPADPDDPALLEVTGVHVLPLRWREGLGSALLEGLADEAWGLGYRRIRCQTDDPAMIGLLEAVGLAAGEHGWTGELEAPVREVAVFSDGIRLGQFLKLAGLVETGAEAKALLAEGGVLVNGELEDRRGRQLVEGDLVTARDSAVRVHLPR